MNRERKLGRKPGKCGFSGTLIKKACQICPCVGKPHTMKRTSEWHLHFASCDFDENRPSGKVAIVDLKESQWNKMQITLERECVSAQSKQ